MRNICPMPGFSPENLPDAFLRQLEDRYSAAEARWLWRTFYRERSGRSPLGLDLHEEKEETFIQLEQDAQKLAQGMPWQYVMGHCHFFGLRLALSPAVLIPRPETEELVEMILKAYREPELPQHIADWGTGSGCLALALKKHFAEAEVWAFDLEAEALDMARSNGQELGLSVNFAQRDLLAPGEGFPSKFDLMVSNPPYIPLQEREGLQAQVRDWEPPAALFVPSDSPLLFYRALLEMAKKELQPEGELWVETHQDYGQAVAADWRNSGWTAECLQDFSGHWRFVRAKKNRLLKEAGSNH